MRNHVEGGCSRATAKGSRFNNAFATPGKCFYTLQLFCLAGFHFNPIPICITSRPRGLMLREIFHLSSVHQAPSKSMNYLFFFDKGRRCLMTWCFSCCIIIATLRKGSCVGETNLNPLPIPDQLRCWEHSIFSSPYFQVKLPNVFLSRPKQKSGPYFTEKHIFHPFIPARSQGAESLMWCIGCRAKRPQAQTSVFSAWRGEGWFLMF